MLNVSLIGIYQRFGEKRAMRQTAPVDLDYHFVRKCLVLLENTVNDQITAGGAYLKCYLLSKVITCLIIKCYVVFTQVHE